MGSEIDEINLKEMSDEALTPVLHFVNELSRELHPRHVDLSLGDLRTFADFPGNIRRRFVVHEETGDLVAMSEVRYPDDGSNPDVLRCEIRVGTEHRRQGLGTMLLGHIAGIATELGRRTLLSWHFDTVPAGAAFARTVGAEEKLQFHDNVLRIEDLDVELMRSWATAGPERAPGYSVEVITGRWPQELLEGIAHLYYVLERDMPTSAGLEPREWTAELIDQMQNHLLQSIDALTAIAFEDATGDPVGMSQLIRRHSDPTTWTVTTTMVDPEHRGKAIGKWVKGAANLAALEAWKGGVNQETGNAFTNEAMLAINRAMGFEHEMTTTDVEIEVDDALAYVSSKTGASQ
ncbi:MAG: GNAT family N-acetyltransferase [Acidimicrobiia bacterium]